MLIDLLNRQLRERDAQSLRRRRRIAEEGCAPLRRVGYDGRPATESREMLAFCSNDYLGLANHPVLIEALSEGARMYGAGSGASHLVCGHTRAHAALEDDLAAWMAPNIPGAAVLTFSTGYMANLALLTALGCADATIFADKLNHASLVDGALTSQAKFQRYPHGNLQMLERQLQTCQTEVRLIVCDAVFSMDGDIADLTALLALADRFNAWLIVDDAHGFGVLGARGRGTPAHHGLCSERLIVMGTLGKAAGLAGAFVAAHPTIIEWLAQVARTYIYTTAAPPATAHALRASLELMDGREGEQRRRHLQALIHMLRSELSNLMTNFPSLGWRLAESFTAIQPLIVGDNAEALAVAAALDAQGLWVPAIRPPTVPFGTARLRMTLSAAHSEADVRRLVKALHKVAGELL